MTDEAPIDQGNPWDKVREMSQRLETKDRKIARLRADKVILQDALNVRTDLAIQQDAEIERLRALVKELADELEPLVEQYYAKTKDYPSELRRYERDIEPVKRARAALKDTTP